MSDQLPPGFIPDDAPPGFVPDSGGLTPEKKAKLQAGIAKQKAKVDALNAQPDPMSIGEIAKNVIPTTAALADKFNSGLTFGAYPAAERLISPAAAAATQERSKLLDSGPGQFAGNFMSNVGGNVTGGKLGEGLAGVIEQRLPALATKAAGRVATSAAVGAGVGGVAGATEAASAGEDLKGIGKRALVGGALGAGLGGGMSAVGEIAGKVSTAIRGNPQTKRYLDAKEAGVYDEPAMASLPKGRQGMQEAADTTVEKMAGREKSLADDAEAAWNLTGSDPAVLKKPVDTQLIKGVLHAGRLKHIDPDTGMPADGSDAIVNAYDKAIERTPDNATVEGTLKRRQSMKKAAAFDNPNPSPEQMAARDVYHTFRTAVRDASPELATADDAFSTHSKAAERRSELVGTDLTTANPAQLEGAAARIGRIGDENVPGMRVQKRLAELQASDPEIAAAIEFLANKKAQEAVRFGGAHMPTHLSAAVSGAGIPRFIQQNSRAIGAKLVDPMARGLSGASQTAGRALPSFLPQIEQEYADAMQRLRQQQQENQ